MKSKEQKRAEAIERARISFASKHQFGVHRRFNNEEQYLDLFRSKAEIVNREFDLMLLNDAS